MRLWNIHVVDWLMISVTACSTVNFWWTKRVMRHQKSRKKRTSRCLGTRQLCTLCSPKVPQSQLTFEYGCTLTRARVNGFGTLFSENEPWRKKLHITIEAFLSNTKTRVKDQLVWLERRDKLARVLPWRSTSWECPYRMNVDSRLCIFRAPSPSHRYFWHFVVIFVTLQWRLTVASLTTQYVNISSVDETVQLDRNVPPPPLVVSDELMYKSGTDERYASAEKAIASGDGGKTKVIRATKYFSTVFLYIRHPLIRYMQCFLLKIYYHYLSIIIILLFIIHSFLFIVFNIQLKFICRGRNFSIIYHPCIVIRRNWFKKPTTPKPSTDLTNGSPCSRTWTMRRWRPIWEKSKPVSGPMT